jgi:uncharacterized membrane protein YdjX (TVP38/TMEM64 family)
MSPRIAVLLALALTICGFAWHGRLAEFSDPAVLQSFFRDHGALGPLVYAALFSLLQPFGVMGFFFIAAGALVWDAWTLYLASWLGAVGAGVVGFAFARSFGREFAARHLPASAHRYDELLARNAFAGVLTVRLVAGLWQPAHFLLGLSRVGFWPYLAGTTLGFAPQVALLTWTGASVADYLASEGTGHPAWLAAAIAAGIAAFVVIRSRRARRRSQGVVPSAESALRDRVEPSPPR